MAYFVESCDHFRLRISLSVSALATALVWSYVAISDAFSKNLKTLGV